jgi:hypothetical protein
MQILTFIIIENKFICNLGIRFCNLKIKTKIYNEFSEFINLFFFKLPKNSCFYLFN